MNTYLESIIKRDPAARDKLSFILTYPGVKAVFFHHLACLLYTSPSPRDAHESRMPSSA